MEEALIGITLTLVTLIEVLALVILIVIFKKTDSNKKQVSKSFFDKIKSINGKNKDKAKDESKSSFEQTSTLQNTPKTSKTSKKSESKKLGWHQAVIIAIYAILMIFIVYIAMANLAPESTPGTQSGSYKISSSGLIPYSSEMRSFYIDKDNALGKKAGTEDKTYRSIATEEPFNLVFKPKKIIAPRTNAELEIKFQNFGTDLYVNEELAIPNLVNYSKVKSFSNEKTSVWVKDSIKKTTHENANNAKDFIYRNYPNIDYYSFKELEGGI